MFKNPHGKGRSSLMMAAQVTSEGLVKVPVTWSDVRARIDEVAKQKGEWGGLPCPIEHMRLILEPRHPFKNLHGAKPGAKPTPPAPAGNWTLLNSWRCVQRSCNVFVCREANGKSRAFLAGDGPGRRLGFWINTLGVASNEVWDLAAEQLACEKLRDLVTPHAYRCYMLSGAFLETSKRSGVTYMFRKLRPTVALKPDRAKMMEAIAVLCLHPLGYYEESWAGVMCPTDDVIAHLMLMRGDEHWFWKKANHHPMSNASAGI